MKEQEDRLNPVMAFALAPFRPPVETEDDDAA